MIFLGLPERTPEFRTRTSGTPKSLFPGAEEDHLLCLMIHFNKTSDIKCETTGHQDCKTMAQGYSSQPGGPKGPADYREFTIQIAEQLSNMQCLFAAFFPYRPYF